QPSGGFCAWGYYTQSLAQNKLACRMGAGNGGLPAKIGGVLASKVGPLLRQVVERENRRYRTNRNTSPAVDTLHRIDINQLFSGELGIFFFGMDAIHRAGVHTCRVFGSDA